MTDENPQGMSNEALGGEIARVEAQIESATGSKLPEPTKEDIFSHSADKKLSSELGAIWDKAERRERKPEMPAIEGEKLADRVTRAHEWTAMSAAERRLESDAAKDVGELKALAEKYGVSIAEAEAIKTNALLQQNSELGPIADDMRAVFKDSTPAESAKFFRQTAEAFRQDPIATLAHLGGQAGLHPMQLAQLIAQRYGNQQPQQPMQQYQTDAANLEAYRAVEGAINAFAEQNPQMLEYESEMVEILSSPQFQQSSLTPQQKLSAAFKVVLQRDKGKSIEDKMDRTMRSIANRRGTK
jgi:hypothetical protein